MYLYQQFNSRQFNNLFSDSSNSNCFSLFHLNIRSFKKHSVDLEEYLSTLNTSFSAIGLSETWLDTTSNDLYSIPGYHFISKPRPVGSGGGVGGDTFQHSKRYHFTIHTPKGYKKQNHFCKGGPPGVCCRLFPGGVGQTTLRAQFNGLFLLRHLPLIYPFKNAYIL